MPTRCVPLLLLIAPALLLFGCSAQDATVWVTNQSASLAYVEIYPGYWGMESAAPTRSEICRELMPGSYCYTGENHWSVPISVAEANSCVNRRDCSIIVYQLDGKPPLAVYVRKERHVDAYLLDDGQIKIKDKEKNTIDDSHWQFGVVPPCYRSRLEWIDDQSPFSTP